MKQTASLQSSSRGDTVVLEMPLIGLYIFLALDGSYYARWAAGSSHGHPSATQAMLWGMELSHGIDYSL